MKQVPIDIRNKKIRNMNSAAYDNYLHVANFEREVENFTLCKCPSCLSTSLSNDGSCTKELKICSLCKTDTKIKFDKKSTMTNEQQRHKYLLDNEILPVWYKENDLVTRKEPQYHIPKELSELTTAEVLLIQRYSAYIPVFHMSKGHTGFKGHCVCFIQDTQEVCNELPRKKCHMVRIIKHVDERGISMTKNFTVNKDRVICALKWLKIHHRYYKDIKIEEKNLDWMDKNTECEMNVETIVQNDVHCEGTTKRNEFDVTVSEMQTKAQNQDDTEVVGTANNSLKPSISRADKDIFDELRNTVSNNDQDMSFMKFPEINEDAVCEYSEDVLPNIFPHLYPGGIGGSNNHYVSTNEQHLHKYAKRLLNYQDGRFCGDPVWSYYMLDMIQRSKNNKNGNYIIKNGVLGNVCETVDDLKERVQNGDLSWIEMLRNYSKRIRGSDNFWRSKRSEVESWINYHVEHKHGPPTLFLTLSCAENWWKDLQRLLKKKMKGSKYEPLISMLDSTDEKQKMASRSKVSTIFSVIVQEFFQKRVEVWIRTVGRPVFGIKYYWGRYEFAKGRGQIHLHLLAIVEDRSVQHEYFKCVKNEEIERGIDLLSEYATEKLGLTAEHPAYDHVTNTCDKAQVRNCNM